MTTNTDNSFNKNVEDNTVSVNENVSANMENVLINNANVVETVLEDNKHVDNAVVNNERTDIPHVDEDNGNNANTNQDQSNHTRKENTQVNDDSIVAKEAEMEQNLWEITIKSLQMGIDFCVSKFGSDTDCVNIKREIQSLLGSATQAYATGDREGSNSYLRQAETLYSTLDAKLDASKSINSSKVDNKRDNLNQSATTTNERVSTVVSYNITVKGDEHDVRDLITRAKKALDLGKLDQAERLLLKAEGIFTTANARELLQKVEEAKRALNQPAQAENKSISNEVDEENFVKRDEYIRKAYKEIAAKNFEEAKTLLNEAEKLDPKLNVKDALSLVEDAIHRNRAINTLITFAQEALDEKDYEEAHKNIIELQKLDPKKNVKNILLRIKEGLAMQKKAKLALEKARTNVRESKFEAADRCIREAVDTDPDVDVSELKSMLKDAMESQLTQDAKEAIKAKQFSKAAEIVQRMQSLDPTVDVEELSSQVEIGLSKKETSTLVKVLKFVAGVTGVAAIASYVVKKSSK